MCRENTQWENLSILQSLDAHHCWTFYWFIPNVNLFFLQEKKKEIDLQLAEEDRRIRMKYVGVNR